jgi:hypothetical protein
MTRPSPERFAGIALELGLTPAQLEDAAATRTLQLADERGESSGGEGSTLGDERVKDRARRIQQEFERRAATVTQLGDGFNEAHDRARDDFLMRFVAIAREVRGAPQPDPTGLHIDEANSDGDPAADAKYRQRFTSYGVAHALAGGAGGAFAGAAVGGAAAYGTFMTAVTLGSASTGAAIAGLSGAAASNAALALLGGGTLAAGGAGVAGGTALLAGIVAAPALLLTIGGLVWMVRRRNRKQQEELSAKLAEADREIAESQRGFEALTDILPRATAALNYIAIHASHALMRWESQIGPPPLDWNSMSPAEQQQYQDFIDVAACQLSIVTINVHDLLSSRGEDREQRIEFADEVLSQAQSTIETLV